MPIIPTVNEREAVQCANQFKALTNEIKNVDKNTSKATVAHLKKKFEELASYANFLLVMIYTNAKSKNLVEVENYYYRYLLEQISRYNQYFNEVSAINDNRDEKTTVAATAFAGKDILKAAGVTAISHSLLSQSAPVSIKVNLHNKDKIFTSHFEYVENNKLHHYYDAKNEKNIAEGRVHQDLEEYPNANAGIFAATQSSNVRSILKQNWGQATDSYFKITDREEHGREKLLFETALANIHEGQTLRDEQLEVLANGKFYRYPKPISFLLDPKEVVTNAATPNHKITHVGHASEILTMNNQIPLTLSIDPVHYQSGTGGLLGVAAKTFYDRNTAPALSTDSYPKMNVVIISHNHHDHMCPCSLQESFAHSNTLFIVPKGDAKHMKSSGFGLKNANVVELNSWNDAAEIELTSGGKTSRYEIRSLPAKHASNRSVTDFYESLFMGYMVRDVEKNQVVLFTGDTGVLSEEHFSQLEKYLIENKLALHSACIAHGPDRPRKHMAITHQSTADAVAMHARFTMMNAAAYAKQNNKELADLSFQEIQSVACHGIGYHQGCYRLGVLSSQDVNTTILRMLATLKSVADMPLKDINEEVLKDNIFYRFMDDFEREGLLQTIKNYQRVSATLTAGQAMALVSSHLTIPVPGAAADFQTATPHPGFKFDYESLIQNRDPKLKKAHAGVAYEYYADLIPPELYSSTVKTRELITKGLTIYLERPRNTYKASKKTAVRDFIKKMPEIEDANLLSELGKFYSANFKPQDNGIRDEGHLHTMLTVLGGLIQFPDFRQQFVKRYNEVHVAKYSLPSLLSSWTKKPADSQPQQSSEQKPRP